MVAHIGDRTDQAFLDMWSRVSVDERSPVFFRPLSSAGHGQHHAQSQAHDYVITVEEEGWFEGDDPIAEIQEVGDVY